MIKQLIKIADRLDRNGQKDLADRIDKILTLAQDVDFNYIEDDSFDRGKEQRLLYLMLQRFHNFFNSNIDSLEYLGEENIEILKSSFNSLMRRFTEVMREKDKDFNKGDLQQYNDRLSKIRKKFYQWQKQPLSRTKIITDRYAIFGELEFLYKKLQRLYEDDSDFRQLEKKFKDLINVSNNVIQKTMEQIVDVDITKEY